MSTLKDIAKQTADENTMYHCAKPGYFVARLINGSWYSSGDVWLGTDLNRAWKQYSNPATKMLWTWVYWDADVIKETPV